MNHIKLLSDRILCVNCKGESPIESTKSVIEFRKLHKRCKPAEQPDNRCNCETPKLIGRQFTNYEGQQMQFCDVCKHNRILK